MSKQVRWQVPFRSVSNEQYRVDIYDEGWVGSVTTLQGGEHPIETSEDQSDDYFAPIRPTTGTLRVIDTNGTLLAALMPSDNIARPVRMIHIAANNTETIVWQGFLSCEAYSQDYTAVAQEVELPLNGVLEAMKSVPMPVVADSFKSVRLALAEALKQISTESGMTLWTTIHASAASKDIMSHFVDMTSLYDSKEMTNEESTSYSVETVSCYDMLERVAVFMGWTIREVGQELYFCRQDEEVGMVFSTYAVFINTLNYWPTTSESLTTSLMSDIQYRGTDHKIGIASGAKSVEVVAKIDTDDLNVSLPDAPYGGLTDYDVLLKDKRAYTLVNASNDTFDSRITTQTLVASYRLNKYNDGGGYQISTVYITQTGTRAHTDMSKLYLGTGIANHPFHQQWYAAGMPLNPGGTANTINSEIDLTAVFARCEFYDIDASATHKTTSGLYITGMDGTDIDTADANKHYDFKQSTQALFAIEEPVTLYVNSGWLLIEAGGTFFDTDAKVINSDYSLWMTFSLRVGTKYWNGTAWQSSFATFRVLFEGGTIVSNKLLVGATDEDSNGWFVPITGTMNGKAQLCIYGEFGHRTNPEVMPEDPYFPSAAFLTTLSLSHLYPLDDKRSKRKENTYFRLLGNKFSDEISVSTDIATDLNNQYSRSMLYNSRSTMTDTINYATAGGTTEARKPERDLLSRLAKYYARVRRTITLVTAGLSSVLPKTLLTGYDTKTYIPVSETKDWADGTTTLTCMEQPAANE